jgi:hypothetical protein
MNEAAKEYKCWMRNVVAGFIIVMMCNSGEIISKKFPILHAV